MAMVASAAFSRDLYSPDETRMGCWAHLLNDVLKSVIANYCTSEILLVVMHDFSSMKQLSETLSILDGSIWCQIVVTLSDNWKPVLEVAIKSRRSCAAL